MLNLYRRHRQECEAGHPSESRSGEFEERKKGWKKCACLIFASGTLGRNFHRKSTGKSSWDDAKAVSIAWETAGTWNESPTKLVATSAAPPTDQIPRTTVRDAAEAFIASRKNRGIATSTLSKYQTYAKQLLSYCESRGYVFLDQITVADMDRFYASWKDGKRSAAKKLERLKAFIKFCVKRKWLAENIAEDLEAPEGSSIPANKTPFTDAELNRIFAACDAIGDPKPPGPGYRQWSGEDLKDFILLSVYTGLRISDVSTFNIAERLNQNDVFLRMHKTKKELYTWVPDWIVTRLRSREKRFGPMIFRSSGQSESVRTMAELWRVKLSKVFKLAGPFDEKPTPHRFRHTFVRILLEKGVPVGDVAELIGDTEDVVRKHYARWVPERQARLTRILKEAFDDKPTLVAVSRRPGIDAVR